MIRGLRPRTPYTLSRGGPSAPLRSRGSLADRSRAASLTYIVRAAIVAATIAITRATTSSIFTPVVSM